LSSKLAQLVAELDSQKRKYHEKVLSLDGEWSIFLRSFQVRDYTFDLSKLVIPELYFSSMSLSLLFGFDLFDLEPFNIEFTWRYPDLDEWLRGVSIVFERVTPPYAARLEEFARTGIKPEYRDQILLTALEKGVYGVTSYGYSYYDPPAVREFLRAALTLMFKKHPAVAQRRVGLESMVRALNVSYEIVRSTYDRLSMVIAEHTSCFTLDYGFLDLSLLCEEYEADPAQGIVYFTDLDGAARSAAIMTLADAQYGCILDLTTLDYCYLMPDEDIYVHSEQIFLDAVDDKLRRFAERFTFLASGFSNYVRGDEAIDYHKAERTQIWGELLGKRYAVESLVHGILDRVAPDLAMAERRKYVTAVLQLIGHLGKRHRWGYSVYRAMTDEELETWWRDYWVSQGLDRAILNTIYNAVKPLLKPLVQQKIRLGEALRKARLGTI